MKMTCFCRRIFLNRNMSRKKRITVTAFTIKNTGEVRGEIKEADSASEGSKGITAMGRKQKIPTIIEAIKSQTDCQRWMTMIDERKKKMRINLRRGREQTAPQFRQFQERKCGKLRGCL